MVAAGRSRSREVNEDGDTLIEILISIMILSFGVIGIYSALSGSLVAADRVKGRGDASQLVTRVSDAVERADWECAENPLESYAEVLDELRPTRSWAITVTSMSHWGPSRSFEDGCPSPGQDDLFRTQKMTVLVKAPGTRGQQVVELLKRP